MIYLRAFSLRLDIRVTDRWIGRPILSLCPLIGAIGVITILIGRYCKSNRLPFAGTVLLLIATFRTLGISFMR